MINLAENKTQLCGFYDDCDSKLTRIVAAFDNNLCFMNCFHSQQSIDIYYLSRLLLLTSLLCKSFKSSWIDKHNNKHSQDHKAQVPSLCKAHVYLICVINLATTSTWNILKLIWAASCMHLGTLLTFLLLVGHKLVLLTILLRLCTIGVAIGLDMNDNHVRYIR